MRKQKIYLDTSVVSHLDQLDAPDKMNDTLALWEEIKQGMYDVYVSDVVIFEVSANREPKRSLLLQKLSEIQYSLIAVDKEIEAYAAKVISEGILSHKSKDDCLHIACAVIHNCDMILSWNFKHIVRVKTIDGVKIISTMLGYKEIGIYSPSMIIERG